MLEGERCKGVTEGWMYSLRVGYVTGEVRLGEGREGRLSILYAPSYVISSYRLPWTPAAGTCEVNVCIGISRLIWIR